MVGGVEVRWNYDISNLVEEGTLITKECPSGKYLASGSFTIDPKISPDNQEKLAEVVCVL